MMQSLVFLQQLSLSLNYKVQSWITYSVNKMLVNYENKRKHDNVLMLQKEFKLNSHDKVHD